MSNSRRGGKRHFLDDKKSKLPKVEKPKKFDDEEDDWDWKKAVERVEQEVKQ